MTLIRDKIESGHSKEIATYIAQAILSGQAPLQDLLACFFDSSMRICQRASWPLTLIAESNPDLLLPFVSLMIQHLDQPQHDAVIRNTLRSWQFMDLPDEHIGIIYDKCFHYLSDPQVAVAIRVFAMTICVNISERYPELAGEVQLVIAEHMDHSTAGYRARALKEIKRLRGITQIHP